MKPDDKNTYSKMQNILKVIILCSLFDNYALENIALGFLKPNTKIDFNTFVQDLRLYDSDVYVYRNYIDGNIVGKDLKVADKSIDEFLLDFYSQKMEVIWEKSIINSNRENYLPFNIPLRDYLLDVFNVFKEIINTNVQYEFYDTLLPFYEKGKTYEYFRLLTKFVTAIKLRHLRQGSCVDKYVKNLPFLPVAVQRLVKHNRKHYILINSDPTSIDYILALLSLIKFVKGEHYKIFELKAERWRELKISNQ